MAKKSERINLDLNGDGKFDEEDKKIAGKVLATKIEEPVVEKKPLPVKKEEVNTTDEQSELIAKADISRKYRKGSVVPLSQIEKWKLSGINYSVWFWWKINEEFKYFFSFLLYER